MLSGRMMDFPLTTTHLLERARQLFPRTEVVTRRADGSLHRYGYADLYGRVCRVANALRRLGVKPGDRVATLAWNHYRHYEVYCAVPSVGAVLHTLNIRLAPQDLAYIAQHAEDKVVVVDESLLPLLRQFLQDVPSIEHVIVMRDGAGKTLPSEGIVDYEQWLYGESPTFDFPQLDENAAAILCYTSGTTGRPKGVVYSHRSCVLMSLSLCMTDVMGIGQRDTILPVVPMFHANAWGLPIATLAAGAKMVLPGPNLDAKSLVDLMVRERVTLAAGVPTIWLGLLALLDEAPGKHDLSSMRMMVIGGSAAPPAMIDGFKKRHGLDVTHAWGMTEMNPLGTIVSVKPHLAACEDATMLALKASQGLPVPFVEMRHTDDTGAVQPWDGKAMGELEVRGPWVASSYFRDEDPSRWTADGWFKTGDVVTIDAEGYMRICDRSKDVIKSGGEWISSVELENAIMSHPAVLEAAVFAARDDKWGERPLAAVVCKAGRSVTKAELTAHIEAKFVKFWLPDDYLFVDQIPKTSTGKFKKLDLRAKYGDYLTK